MCVELVTATLGGESVIAHIARVSNPNNQDNPEYTKLFRYLIRNGHWSPFEHASMTVKIVTSRAIAAQILRHRSFSFQEFSQRYSEATEFEPIELRRQADKNRQSSTEVFDPIVEYDIHASEFIEDHIQASYDLYRLLIKNGVAKESARMILPLTTQTTLYMSGTVRSFIHYLALRNDEHTQKEHQLIAQEIEQIFSEQYPITYEAIQLMKKEKETKELLWKLFNDGIISIPQ